MPSLKDLRNRIASVKSTRKITSAMKMVAASKLRRAQEQATAGQPYAERMEGMLARLAANLPKGPGAPRLLAGTGSDKRHLLIVVTSDRGLAGGFNAQIARETRRQIARLEGEGKQVMLMLVGRKGRDALRRDHASKIGDTREVGRAKVAFADAEAVANKLLEMFEADQFDVASIVYNRFRSVVSQVATAQQLIPFAVPKEKRDEAEAERKDGPKAVYEFEPDEETILKALLPRNVAIQIYRAMLDSAAGFYAAQMQAMDAATRNAGEMINKTTLAYNRARQAYITKELIEIISGAEAL